MFNKLLTILFASLIGTLSTLSLSFAQYTFDVKTPLAEKEDLQNYKQGLLTVIENSNWARNDESGEDYSLWLHTLDRDFSNDSMTVYITVEVRTPAMFTRGHFIGNRRIWIQYNYENAKTITESDFSEESYSDGNVNYEESLSRMTSSIGLISSFGLMDVSGVSSKSIDGFLRIFGTSFKRRPSPIEVMESMLIGNEALNVARIIIHEEN